MKKYEVEVKEKKGSLDNDLFETMAKNGDIVATKVKDEVGQKVTITGYADVHIVTDDKDFNVTYYDTKEDGLLSSGSEIFKKSVVNYFGKIDQVQIMAIKTKQGNSFKAVPVLGGDIKKEETTETVAKDDLPF